MSTSKQQFSFYADRDVAEYLNSQEFGHKSRLINTAIRALMKKKIVERDVSKRVAQLEKEIKSIIRKEHK